MTDRPRPDPAPLLADLAVVALVVAHGMDAELDPRESVAVARRLREASPSLAGEDIGLAELSGLIEAAVRRYGRVTVPEFEALVSQTGAALGAERRAEAFGVLVAVAEADGVVRPMERTLLRHIAQAWNVQGPAPDGPEAH